MRHIAHTVGARCVLVAVTVAASFAASGALALTAGPVQAERRPVVSGQPVDGVRVDGPGKNAVRRAVVRSVRSRGLRVTTDIPKAQGTGQYYTWAREVGLKAFVSSEVIQIGRRRRATFLVWSGHDGAVVGRWTVSARPQELPRVVARGFWPRLGPSFRKAQVPPEWRQIGPGPTQRIDAGRGDDETIAGHHLNRRRRPLSLR